MGATGTGAGRCSSSPFQRPAHSNQLLPSKLWSSPVSYSAWTDVLLSPLAASVGTAETGSGPPLVSISDHRTGEDSVELEVDLPFSPRPFLLLPPALVHELGQSVRSPQSWVGGPGRREANTERRGREDHHEGAAFDLVCEWTTSGSAVVYVRLVEERLQAAGLPAGVVSSGCD
jgi:hypothetical protein